MTKTTIFENEAEQQSLLPQQDTSLQHTAPKRGFTLTEIAIVLGIIGLILGAIWVAAAAVYNNLRTSKAVTATLQTAQAVRALYATSNTTGLTVATDLTATMVSSGVIPADLSVSGPFPNGAFGVVGTSDGRGFVIVMTAVPQSNCIALLTQIAGTSRDPGLYNASAVASAAIAAGDASTTGTPTTVAIAPTTMSAAVTGTAPNQFGGCTAANNPAKVRIGFTLK